MTSELIKKKIVALLHDPYHKPYVVANVTGRIFATEVKEERAHEAEAKAIAKKLGINFFEKYLSEVVNADRFAAALDRIMVPGEDEKKEGRSKSVLSLEFINVFDPTFTTDVTYKADEKNGIEGYYEKLENLIKGYASKCSEGNNEACIKTYHILYALAEALWYKEIGKPPVADTRIPTHTVFDHLAATASVLNILSNSNIDGWLVEVDIPGVQKFIEGARNPGDAWAKSWFLSALAWKLVEELVWELGADILLLPTTRYNPFYYSLLRQKFEENERVQEILEKMPKAKQPVMPATVTLLLPKSKFESEKEIEEYFMERIEEIWYKLVDAFFEDLKENEKIKEMIEESLEKYEISEEEFKKIIKSSRPVRVSVTALDIGKAFEDFDNDWNKMESEIRTILEKIEEKNALKQINAYWDSTDKALNDLKRKLFYHWLFTKKFIEVRKKKKRVKVDVLVYDRWSFEVIDKVYRKFVIGTDEKIESVLKFCPCGRPAVVHNKSDEVKGGVKPKEALCPYCLILRRLQYSKKMRKVLVYDDVEPPKISISTLSALHELAYELKKRKLNNVDLVKIIEGLKRVLPTGATTRGKLFEYEDVLSELRESKEDEEFEYVLSVNDHDVTVKLSKKDLRWLDKLNKYYAVVRADGDGMGEILSGKLKKSWDDVRKYWEGILGNKDIAVNFIVDLMRAICKIYKKQVDTKADGKNVYLKEIDECEEEDIFKFTTLVTPTYQAQISYSQMITAVLDAGIVDALGGVLVFAGGDDILALLPARSKIEYEKGKTNYYDELIQIVKSKLKEDGLRVNIAYFYSPALWAWWLTRLNYWGLLTLSTRKGFHWLENAFSPAPAAFGRKYGIAFRHYRTPLALAFSEANVLEDEAKKVEMKEPFKLPKDGVSMHYGPPGLEGKKPVLPNGLFAYSKKELCLGYVLAKLSALFYIHNVSRNVYEDAVQILDNYSELKGDDKLCRVLLELFAYTIKRNAANGEEGKKILDMLLSVGVQDCKHLDNESYIAICNYLGHYKKKDEDSLTSKLFDLINTIHTLSKVLR